VYYFSATKCDVVSILGFFPLYASMRSCVAEFVLLGDEDHQTIFS